jgi:hypothetical protein
LIVVPHAGYGKNAFYDRDSKSLQFYYFDVDNEVEERNEDKDQKQDEKKSDIVKGSIYTCLSTDIVNHEFGHAMLDGIRPHYMESVLPETGAFHEFIGDFSAILITLRNNEFRKWLADKTDGNLAEAKVLSSIAQQFGEAVFDKLYLRTAQNKLKMSDITADDGPHTISQVLTGAMFDILMRIADSYMDSGRKKNSTSSFLLCDRKNTTDSHSTFRFITSSRCNF